MGYIPTQSIHNKYIQTASQKYCTNWQSHLRYLNTYILLLFHQIYNSFLAFIKLIGVGYIF